MEPNRYQSAVFDFIENNAGNAIVEAVAGSGKTTTIVEALNKIPSTSSAMFCAFNKHIAEELATRAPSFVNVCTLNSFGFGILRNMMGYVKVNASKTENCLWFDIFKQKDRPLYNKVRRDVVQLVALLKAHLVTDPTLAEINFIAENYGMELNENTPRITLDTFTECMAKPTVIDFDDQIYLPLARNYMVPKYDYVFVDEAQDLTLAQMELVQKAARRVIAVGDSRQAIYGFRGACNSAITQLKNSTNATVLPLSICYRCSKAVVREAQAIVSHIEYSEDAPEGEIRSMNVDEYREAVQEGDYVLCRTTAPLVKEALLMIRAKRKAVVKGREIGEALIATVEQITGSNKKELTNEILDAYENRMREKIKNDVELVALQDKIDTLKALLVAYDDVCVGIRELFSNTMQGIIYSTIHRSKGLEKDQVYLLCPHLLPHPRVTQDWAMEQERNLHYIAITRAKNTFTYVGGEI